MIRHAQSQPSAKRHHSEWPLSAVGEGQATGLSGLLKRLNIEIIVSSPFARCLQTLAPFASAAGMTIDIDEGLRERLISEQLVKDFDKIWRRSWEDFDYALPGCESSAEAQVRFVAAVRRLRESHRGKTIGIGAHGNVIALFLNWIDGNTGRSVADKLTNPDVIKIVYAGDHYEWDRQFELPGLKVIATDHRETPVEM